MKKIRKIILRFLNPLSKIIGYLIKKYNITIVIDSLKINFPSQMQNVELGYSILGTYEKNERFLVKKYVKPNDRVLEMGACIGVVSCTINRILNDKTKQVSIEPNPQMLEYLIKNRELNNSQFEIETAIITNKDEVDFYMGGQAFLSSNTIQNKGYKIKKKGLKFNELINKYFEFNVLVMDIEGGELDFFRNFDIGKTAIELVIFETHLGHNLLNESEYNECFELLTKYGFKRIDNKANVEVWRKYNNY